ncbi:DUF3102 domain-containing protein [Zestomonas carbonaria]|uniref:DUF3102 domain-containing protein n=1 Tax=Zestomonas carbonaria TaxID=2762745 RepID=A0A7U7ELH2_9GAMM|nr:DUF3102 domain-containing protein [Pseudomonas carbonaria]CAD5107209.1 hypothetical protein PSEWESI4_01480 [Pseudomonas carbonaria]
MARGSDKHVEEHLERLAGRKPGKAAELLGDTPIGSGLTAAQHLAAEHALQVMREFGDGLPYDRLRYLDKARFHMARSAEEALAVGRCLIVMKENEPHGEWLGILEQLGIEQSLARRMAQAALKFGGIEAPKALIEAAKSKSKLFELMVLDDDELQALTDGGSVAGLELDDIERMPVSQLRAALREMRSDKQAQGRILAEKNARIDELSTDLDKARRQVQAMTADQRARQLREEVAALAYVAETDITGSLREGFAKLAAHADEHGGDHRGFKALVLRQLETQLQAIRSEFHLPADLDPEAEPDWLHADPDTLLTGGVEA